MNNCQHDNARGVETIMTRRFDCVDLPGGFFAFRCDADGTIRLDELAPAARANAEACLRGERRTADRGVIAEARQFDATWIEYDARGIPLGRVCDDCVATLRAKYRPDVLTDPNYWHDEPIDADE